jgi:hypothetical protein
MLGWLRNGPSWAPLTVQDMAPSEISFDACLALPRVNKPCRARLRHGVVSTLGQLRHRSIRIAGHGSAMDSRMLEWLRHGSTTVTSHGSAIDSLSSLGGSATGPTNVTAHGSATDSLGCLSGSATGPLM